MLDIPKYGCLNVHGSILPRWRGAAPVQRAIWSGDKETGVTIMLMDAGLDTGDMLHKATCAITSDETSLTLYDKLAELSPPALLHVLDSTTESGFKGEKQDNSKSSYAQKLTKEEAKINWSSTSEAIALEIRAFTPWPSSYFEYGGEVIKVHKAVAIAKEHNSKPGTVLSINRSGVEVATSDGILNIEQIQFPGKKSVSIKDVLNTNKERFVTGALLA